MFGSSAQWKSAKVGWHRRGGGFDSLFLEVRIAVETQIVGRYANRRVDHVAECLSLS